MTTERETFERGVIERNADAYDRPECLLERNLSGDYATTRINGEWIGYQAGRKDGVASDLIEALRWYVLNDDVNLWQAGNEYWIEGYNNAVAAIAKATKDAK
tara:strand:- start:311 stop:616 length:306 start_codon:yes stop_codon:yes gene_type:complete